MIEIRKERQCQRVNKFNIHSSFVIEYIAHENVFALWFGSFETARNQGGSHSIRERDNASMILTKYEMQKLINDMQSELDEHA